MNQGIRVFLIELSWKDIDYVGIDWSLEKCPRDPKGKPMCVRMKTLELLSRETQDPPIEAILLLLTDSFLDFPRYCAMPILGLQ